MSVSGLNRGVVFDMGDILYDATGWRRWLAVRLAEGEAVDIDYPRLVIAWERALVPVYTGRTPYWDAFRGFLKEYGVSGDRLEVLRDEAQEQGRLLSQSHKPFPGIADGLARMMEGGLRLAILSDNESTEAKVRGKLRRFGIESFFDVVLTSVDIGAVKPTPEAFDKSVDALGLTRESTAFVAHDLDELKGGMDYGLYTVAFNYEGAVPADFHAETFDQAAAALIAWGQRPRHGV